ncbi:SusD/RagB family nutrient-binding outer membrane lipoprotein [Compostibacter hankyongensis]|uniref:SusD/RagB family nutrient-binding outer membrane lipoprotein n=1 Tax=Compostibacter hankyongensis TaxID=1007089 RepID=A0ABP8FY32_9BACT
MKPYNNIRTVLTLVTLLLVFPGCKKFLDINENPNKPETADPTLLLPSAEASTGFALGNNFQIYGNMWGQYWTQNPFTSQYKSIDDYQPSPSSYTRPWRELYSGALQDLKVIIGQGGDAKYAQHAAIALILRAYTFQLLTDAFGDIPLKQALSPDSILNPAYDTQEEVYDSIFSMIDQAKAIIDPDAEFVPGGEDLLFGGDMDKWTAFANTLKLRAYLRLSEVDPEKAKAGIAALYTSGAEFLDEDAKISYSATGGNQNPFFTEMVGLGYTQNPVASATCVDAMKENDDPRVTVFYTVPDDTGEVVSIPQGSYNDEPDYTISSPSAAVGADGDDPTSAQAPVKFISAAESYFLQAEAVARGWADGDAKTLFTQGIKASFEAYGIGDQAQAYIGSASAAQWPGGGVDGQVQAIITQKYFAMCGNQGFEAWTEWRRTGYPDFFITSQSSILSGDQKPLRFLYPESEMNQNLNFPGLKDLTAPVWWDK